MKLLSDEACIRVDKTTPALSPAQIQVLLDEVPGWQLVDHQGMQAISRTFKFQNFQKALDFTNLVGQQAEGQDHHPAILTEWGQVTVIWWTHVVNGLHRNDFIMAARTDKVFDTKFRN